MVRVALAGGTGGFGRTLVDAVVAAGEHDIFVLTRRPTHLFDSFPRTEVLVTSYSDEAELMTLLQKHEIATVISALNPPVPQVFDAQINLIRASAKSRCVKRFVPSEFALDYSLDDDHLPLSWKHLKVATVRELESHPSLEYTLIHNGYFMDYFGLPHAPTYMIPEVPFIDIPARKAAIPGDGNQKVVFTHTTDVARFTVRLLNEEASKWEKTSMVVGDRLTFNQILDTAEKARDKKFDVVYDSIERLRSGEVTEIPAYFPLYELFGSKEGVLEMYAAFGLAMALGDLDYHDAGSLNEKYPDMRTIKLADFISQYWSGR